MLFRSQGMVGNAVHAPARGQGREQGLVTLHHRPIGLASHLDLAHREGESLITEIPVIDGQGLLKHRGVGLMGEGHQGLALVVHIIATHLIRTVGQPSGMVVVGRHQQQPGGIGGSTTDHHQITAEAQLFAIALHNNTADGTARGIGLQAANLRAGEQGEGGIRLAEGGPDSHHLGITLGMHQTGIPVAAIALEAESEQELERLRGPIGIYIGSKTPAEIAVSIMAEVLAVKNGVPLPRDMDVAHAKNTFDVAHNDPGVLVCGVR